MNKYKNIHHINFGVKGQIVHSILTMIGLLPFYFFFVACSDEIQNELTTENLRDNEALVHLTVNLPSSSVPRNTTRAINQTDNIENRIEEITILVFEEENGQYIYRYMATGKRIQATNNTTQFQAKLTGTTKSIKLMLAGNYGDAFADYTPSPGNSEDEVKANMGTTFTGILENLPMYGEITIKEGLHANEDNNFNVKMLRSVARIDIEKSLNAISRPFVIESVRVYRPNDKLQIAPQEALDEVNPIVTKPSIFTHAQKSTTPINVEIKEDDPTSITGIYVSEANSASDPEAQLTEATCIVVGGYYDGQTKPTYYRIDFNPGYAEHPFGQILRNHKYIFRIKQVNGSGWSEPDLAATHKAMGITAEIDAWEDVTTSMFFEGDNYFGVSSRNVSLGYLSKKTKSIDIQTSVPFTIQWLDLAGSPIGNIITGNDSILPDNENFSVQIQQDTEENISHLVFTTTKDNRTDQNVTSKLRITASRWILDITITQENPSKYRNRVVRVFSVRSVGSLGANPPSNASGLALRRILDNPTNFSPEGTVIIGGFAFSEGSTSDLQQTSTSNKETYNSIKQTLNAQDVIYLSYNTPISEELAQVILAWLEGSPNRVLIVGTDTQATNLALLKHLTQDGTWTFNNTNNGFKRAPQTEDNKRFFSSPFGIVTKDAPIQRVDGIFGLCSDYPQDVTPLAVSNTDSKAQVLGINLKKRIIYHGDANLNQNGPLSSNGTITTDFDRLTANMWAWIVEQVCETE